MSQTLLSLVITAFSDTWGYFSQWGRFLIVHYGVQGEGYPRGLSNASVLSSMAIGVKTPNRRISRRAVGDAPLSLQS